MTALAGHMSAFLREYLPRDKRASPRTVDTYSQGLSLLIRFAADRFKVRPSQLALEQIDADLVLAFLEDIERKGASVSTEKLEMLDGARMPNLRPGRFRPPDKLLAMLNGNDDEGSSKD